MQDKIKPESNIIVILARTFAEAKYFAKINNISERGFIYPDSFDRLCGLRFPFYICLDGWQRNESNYHVHAYLESCNAISLLDAFCRGLVEINLPKQAALASVEGV